jgi:hypothetical protein
MEQRFSSEVYSLTADQELPLLPWKDLLTCSQEDATNHPEPAESPFLPEYIISLRPHYKIILTKWTGSRWQWSRGLRHELSSLARTLGSWILIPLKAWMSCELPFCLCCSVCRQRLLRRVNPSSKKSYQLSMRLRNWKRLQCPTKEL